MLRCFHHAGVNTALQPALHPCLDLAAFSSNKTVVRFICCDAACREGYAMPKLKPDVQRARSEHILDAAERCFVRAGFHRTSIHDICKEAAISPGALYVYFDS